MNPFSYTDAPKKEIPCNLCGVDNVHILAKEGSEGLSITTVICKNCGLIYISPRMPKEWYDRYYQFEYRVKTISPNKGVGKRVDFEAMFAKQTEHGETIANAIAPFILQKKGIWVEVGSSAGGVLQGIKKVLGVEVLGVEPSEEEALFAEQKGIPTIKSLIEDIDMNDPRFQNIAGIICTQSLNHLLDPNLFFRWSHEHLREGGNLFLEVMNFEHQLERSGYFRNSVQIDHVYMFTPEVLIDFVVAAGFKVLSFSVDKKDHKEEDVKKKKSIPPIHIRILAQKENRVPFSNIVVHKKNYMRLRRSLSRFHVYLKYLFYYRIPKFLDR